jgi:hypothetical protein
LDGAGRLSPVRSEQRLDALALLLGGAANANVDRAAPSGNLVPLGAVYLTERIASSHLACTTAWPRNPAAVQAIFYTYQKCPATLGCRAHIGIDGLATAQQIRYV